jgi:mono/diheme cytochrome c family protein/small nuclear ribonucleoprotein (snRNP)-like protein
MLSSWGTAAIAIAAAGLFLPVCAQQMHVAEQQTSQTAAGSIAETSRGEDFPRPPADPKVVARGKQIFSVNCGFCHGSDARGGETGPNLLRSPIVLNDQKGEIIAAVVLNGRVEKGMPKFNLSMENIADIAAFVHGLHVGREQGGAVDPAAILVGNASAGKKYFYGKGRCSLCHSLRGDFANIGTKFDPKTLQDNIISGGVFAMLGAPLPTAPPQTVTLTLGSGEIIKGTLISIDDFNVSLTDAAGRRRTLRRDGTNPRVEVHNPMQAHLDMLRNWEDRDIHNLTAFLMKQK